MADDDFINQIKAILQAKFNISYSEIKNMTDEELTLEWAKFKWFSNESAKAMSEIKNE